VAVPDEEMLRAFEAGWRSSQGFHHLDHLRVVWAYLRRDGRFETVLERFPRLADKTLPLAHYWTLDSITARTGWVAPDLRPLP
jgi:hypothetical protein